MRCALRGSGARSATSLGWRFATAVSQFFISAVLKLNTNPPTPCQWHSARPDHNKASVHKNDDDELIVRASAVLKSQGPENWSRGRPGLRWARTNSRSARDASCGKIRGKTAGGVTSCDAAGPGYLWYSFRLQMRGRDLSQHIKAFRSGKGVHVRRVSPVPGRLLCDVSAVRQSAIR